MFVDQGPTCNLVYACINLTGCVTSFIHALIYLAACHPTNGQSGSFAASVKTIVSERSHAQLLAV